MQAADSVYVDAWSKSGVFFMLRYWARDRVLGSKCHGEDCEEQLGSHYVRPVAGEERDVVVPTE